MLTKSQVKYIQSLSHKKFRDSEGVFVAEGPKIINDFLDEERLEVRQLFATEEWIRGLSSRRKDRCGDRIQEIKPFELDRVSFLTQPHQVLGLFDKPHVGPFSPEGIVILLDGIQDPGNMGTIIRCADWFGIGQLICSPESADAFGPKVVQASMGSIARVSVRVEELNHLVDTFPAIPVYAATLEGEDLFTVEKPDSAFLLIGNESRGLDPVLKSRASRRIRIPGRGRAESLNAAVATGILLAWLSGTQ